MELGLFVAEGLLKRSVFQYRLPFHNLEDWCTWTLEKTLVLSLRSLTWEKNMHIAWITDESVFGSGDVD